MGGRWGGGGGIFFFQAEDGIRDYDVTGVQTCALPILTAAAPNGFLTPGTTVTLGHSTWDILHTPGHSPGSICFVHEASNQAIVGDTLFAGSIGRYDFPTSNVEDLRHSITDVLMHLPDAMTIYPGHGPSTTIGEERTTNPFVINGF